MKFVEAKDLAKKVKGSKIIRAGDEHVVIDENGEAIKEADLALINSEKIVPPEQPIQNEKANTKETLAKKPTKLIRRVKGVGPDMRWKGKKLFQEPTVDMMDSGKVYKGSYGTGKKR